MCARRQRALALALGAALFWLSAAPAWAGITTQDDKDIAEIGDWVQIALPVGGYVLAWVKDDKQGAYQLTKSLAAAGITAHFWKAVAERTRPDAADARSFPSGHTTAAFAGSEYIRVRYGNGWGIPATVAAAFVGYSRIRANKHFRDDVLAGASNGLMWNWYFASPESEIINLRPVRVDDGYGFEFEYNFDGDTRLEPGYKDRPKFSYTIEWGPVTQDTNLFQSPTSNGTVLDLATAEEEFDFTSRATFTHNFRPRHEWSAYLAPMELIEFAPSMVIQNPVIFGTKTFTPTPESNYEGRYNFVETRLLYRYTLVDNDRWTVKLGGGLQYTDTLLELTQFNGNPKDQDIIEFERSGTDAFNLMASAHFTWQLSPRWQAAVEAEGYPGSDYYYNTALMFTWHATPGWDLGFGWRYIDFKTTEGGIFNELAVGDIMLRVSHGFH